MIGSFNHGGEFKLPKAVYAKTGSLWTPVQKLYVRHAGFWQTIYQNEVVVTLTSTTGVLMRDLFTVAQWTDPNLKKRVVIPIGVDVYASAAWGAIAVMNGGLPASDSWAGSLTLDIHGTISGIGGTANSGVGGTAILANFSGINGEKLLINNYGTIRPGGGGGGRGGNGGPGTNQAIVATEGPAYSTANPRYFFFYAQNTANGTIWWAGTQYNFNSGSFGPVQIGGYVFTYGSIVEQYGGPQYQCTVIRQTIGNVGTSGGVAGNAGRGQGSDGAATSGSSPVAGGTNAGASGKSGDGGPWGQPGQVGATGASGNAGAGLAGAAAGLAGFHLSGIANAILNNYGTLLGRLG